MFHGLSPSFISDFVDIEKVQVKSLSVMKVIRAIKMPIKKLQKHYLPVVRHILIVNCYLIPNMVKCDKRYGVELQ